jgi:hypothetical protein
MVLPGPIGAEAARRGLTADDIAAADREDVRVEQAKLDEAELQELEHAEYYDEPTAAPTTSVVPSPASPGIIDRLRALLRMGR